MPEPYCEPDDGGARGHHDQCVAQPATNAAPRARRDTAQSGAAIAPALLGRGQTNVIVHHLITREFPEIVAHNESFHQEIGSFSRNDNGF